MSVSSAVTCLSKATRLVKKPQTSRLCLLPVPESHGPPRCQLSKHRRCSSHPPPFQLHQGQLLCTSHLLPSLAPSLRLPLREQHRWHPGSKEGAPKSPLLEAGWEMDALKLSKALGKEAEAQRGAACVPLSLCLAPTTILPPPGALPGAWFSLGEPRPGAGWSGAAFGNRRVCKALSSLPLLPLTDSSSRAKSAGHWWCIYTSIQIK